MDDSGRVSRFPARTLIVALAFLASSCLPHGLHDKPSVGTGTVLRPAALEAMSRDAGFSRFTILPTEHDSFRFYRLDP